MKKIFIIFFIIFFCTGCAVENGRVQGSEIEITNPELKVIFFDVGQGDSALIITPSQKTILIDGGPDNTVIYKLGQYLPFWRRDLDLVVLSHPHADHLVGLNEVLKRFEVKKILMTDVLHTTYEYEEWLKQIQNQQIPFEIAISANDILLEPDVLLQILYPTENLSGRKMENLNNDSIVLKIIYGQSSILFTGDLEVDAQSKIIDKDPSALILKFPHHGSSDGYSEKFVEAVAPKYAVISVGENNFGQPSPRTINALKRQGVTVLMTISHGDIDFSCDLLTCILQD